MAAEGRRLPKYVRREFEDYFCKVPYGTCHSRYSRLLTANCSMKGVMTKKQTTRQSQRQRLLDVTRGDILVAARKGVGKDWPGGLSVVQVAIMAGVNRGTAYQH